MRHLFFSTAIVTGLLFAPIAAQAVGPVNEAQWPGTSIRSGFHESIANAGCVFAGLGSSNTWNAAGSQFSIVTDVFSAQPRVSEQSPAFNNQNVTVEDASVLSNPNALMETRVTRAPGGATILNADIFVVQSRLDPALAAPGEFYCLLSSDTVPADQVDFESALLHEYGHALGFQITSEYQDDNTCSMYFALAPGESRRVLCPEEKTEYISAYGANPTR